MKMTMKHAYVLFTLSFNSIQHGFAFKLPSLSYTRCGKFQSWVASSESDFSTTETPVKNNEKYRHLRDYSSIHDDISTGNKNFRKQVYDSTISARPLGPFFVSEKDVFIRQNQKPSQTKAMTDATSHTTRKSTHHQIRCNFDDFSSRDEWLNEFEQRDSFSQAGSLDTLSTGNENQFKLVEKTRKEVSKVRCNLDDFSSKDEWNSQFEQAKLNDLRDLKKLIVKRELELESKIDRELVDSIEEKVNDPQVEKEVVSQINENKTDDEERLDEIERFESETREVQDSIPSQLDSETVLVEKDHIISFDEVEKCEMFDETDKRDLMKPEVFDNGPDLESSRVDLDDEELEIELLKQRREELLNLKSEIDNFLVDTNWISQLDKTDRKCEENGMDEMKHAQLPPSRDQKVRCNPSDFDTGRDDWASEFDHGENQEETINPNMTKELPQDQKIRCNPSDFDTGRNDWEGEFNHCENHEEIIIKPEMAKQLPPSSSSSSSSYDPKVAEQRQRELNQIRCNPDDFDTGLKDWSSEFNYGVGGMIVKDSYSPEIRKSMRFGSDMKIAEQRQRELSQIRCNPDDFDTGLKDWSSEFNYSAQKKETDLYSLAPMFVSHENMADEKKKVTSDIDASTNYEKVSEQISKAETQAKMETASSVSKNDESKLPGQKDDTRSTEKPKVQRKASYNMRDKIFG